MAFDDVLAERVRNALSSVPDVAERRMRSMLFVERPGVEADEVLNVWVDRGVDFARSLPLKA